MRNVFIMVCGLLLLSSCTTVDLSGIPVCNFKNQTPIDCRPVPYFYNINVTNALCHYSDEYHTKYVCFDDLKTNWFSKNPTTISTEDFFCYPVQTEHETFCDIVTLPDGTNITQDCKVYPVDNVVCVPRQQVKVRHNVKLY
jgi:hypothetical protein